MRRSCSARRSRPCSSSEFGAGEAFAFDAATFLFSAALLARVRPRACGEQAATESIVRGLRGGWREVRSHAWVWVVIAVFSGTAVYAPWYALEPVIARDVYGGARLFGVLEAVCGVGGGEQRAVAIRCRPARPLRTGMLLVLAWPVQDGLFALGAPAAIVVACAFATGFGFSLFVTWWETAPARRIPPRALSRVSAWDWMGQLAMLPTGYAVAGPLASAAGARTTLAAGSLLGIVLLASALSSRSVRELGQARSAERFPRELAVDVNRPGTAS